MDQLEEEMKEEGEEGESSGFGVLSTSTYI